MFFYLLAAIALGKAVIDEGYKALPKFPDTKKKFSEAVFKFGSVAAVGAVLQDRYPLSELEAWEEGSEQMPLQAIRALGLVGGANA